MCTLLFIISFSANEPDGGEYAYTDLCFRDDPKIDVCIRERINDVIERFHKGKRHNTRAHVYI